MPNYYYDFVLQSRSGVKAHFVVVDSNHKEYRDTDWNQQCKWLRHTLQRTKNRVHWTIILCHHPWKSTGWHGNSSGNLKKMFDNVVKSYPIDFILAGHDHDMQVINVGNKTTQIVVGTGAVVREHQPRNPSPNKMLFCEETLGFGKLSLFKTVAHLRMISPDNTEPIFNTRFLPKSTLYTQKRNLSNRKKSLQ
jgi:3',5'-cyclic AMP phosphodiesterase CpdA